MTFIIIDVAAEINPINIPYFVLIAHTTKKAIMLYISTKVSVFII